MRHIIIFIILFLFFCYDFFWGDFIFFVLFWKAYFFLGFWGVDDAPTFFKFIFFITFIVLNCAYCIFFKSVKSGLFIVGIDTKEYVSDVSVDVVSKCFTSSWVFVHKGWEIKDFILVEKDFFLLFLGVLYPFLHCFGWHR